MFVFFLCLSFFFLILGILKFWECVWLCLILNYLASEGPFHMKTWAIFFYCVLIVSFMPLLFLSFNFSSHFLSLGFFFFITVYFCLIDVLFCLISEVSEDYFNIREIFTWVLVSCAFLSINFPQTFGDF